MPRKLKAKTAIIKIHGHFSDSFHEGMILLSYDNDVTNFVPCCHKLLLSNCRHRIFVPLFNNSPNAVFIPLFNNSPKLKTICAVFVSLKFLQDF